MLFFCLLQLVPQLQHQSIASDMHIFRDWISTKPDRSTEYVRRSNTLAACCLRVHLGLNPAIFNEGFAMFHFHFFWQLFIPVFGPWCLQRILKIIPISVQPSRRAASINACGKPWKACLNISIAKALTANGITSAKKVSTNLKLIMVI